MSKGRLGANLVSNVAFFALNIVVSLWLVSFLVRQLGVAAYGMVPLAVTVAGYFNVITAGLNAAVGRHLTVALSGGDHARASSIFNSSLWAGVLVALLMCVLGLPLLTHIAQWIEVPAGWERDAGWLFFLTVGGLAVTTLGTPFQSVVYSHNRFDLQNLGNILGLVLRVTVVLVLFRLATPQLWHVGASVLAAAVATIAVVIVAARRLAPSLRPQLSAFSWPVVKEVSGTGGWVFISQIGTLLLINIDLLVANKVVGAAAAGQYALVLQWSLLLRNFALVVSGVFGPTILTLHAQNRIQEMIDYARSSVRHLGLVMAIPIGIVCGFSESILRVWLGPEFAPLSLVMVIATAHLALNLAYLPLHNISLATNHVRLPGILQVVAGVVNLGLAIALAKVWGLYGIAIAGGLVLLLRNLVFTPLYAARILDRPWWTFAREALPILLMAVLIFLASLTVSRSLSPASWLSLGGSVCGVGAFGAVLLWTVFLRPEHRALAMDKVRRKLKRT
ncbi:lipopolysaccharide biosynthesis protein [Roseateles amylovorans]|uniref:Oligosaccharide flippase family protein n=1 Tax=Roseateles amylovorans TaxID=2978473 RepID=A0ABY6B273_9BURK|nr:oligosaccharide flippase family protein [Roseateles amylovorans]UXH79501.1 oligosaccharide flippase family protein [Roseateles amylovorans]